VTISQWQFVAGSLCVLIASLLLARGLYTGDMWLLGAPKLSANKDERPAFFWAYAVANVIFLYLGVTTIAAGLSGTP
jgi:hypothetical protein